jgi:hypothetical protein
MDHTRLSDPLYGRLYDFTGTFLTSLDRLYDFA